MATSYIEPSIDGIPTTTINNQRIPWHEDHLNRLAMGGCVVVGLLFVVFLYFFISPLFQNRPVKHPSKVSNARSAESSDTEAGVDMDPTERSTLLAWMHRRSRGRFVDVTGNARVQTPQIPRPPKLEPRSNGKRVNSFFSRISMIPNLVPPSLPPSVYPTPPVTVPPACPVSDTSKRPFFLPYRLSFRSKSSPSDPEEVAAKALLNRVSMASLGHTFDDTEKISCFTADSSLHPSWVPRLQSPSKAVLVDKTREITTSQQISKKQAFSRAKVAGESDPF